MGRGDGSTLESVPSASARASAPEKDPAANPIAHSEKFSPSFPWRVRSGARGVEFECRLQIPGQSYDTREGYSLGVSIQPDPFWEPVGERDLKEDSALWRSKMERNAQFETRPWSVYVGGSGSSRHAALDEAVEEAERRMLAEGERRIKAAERTAEQFRELIAPLEITGSDRVRAAQAAQLAAARAREAEALAAVGADPANAELRARVREAVLELDRLEREQEAADSSQRHDMGAS